MLTEWRVEENFIGNNNPQGCRVRGRPKKKPDGGIVFKQILINAKLQIGKRGKKWC